MARTPEDSQPRTSENFRQRLLTLIEENDCKKDSFARLTGVNKDVITRGALYGIVPSVKSLIKIADALQYPIDYILGDTDDPRFYSASVPTTFHTRLAELTAENKVKYSEISNKMFFAKNSIYEWNRTGGLPSLEYLRALAEYFHVNIDYLLGRTDDRN